MRPRNHLVPMPAQLRADGTERVGRPPPRVRLADERLPLERVHLQDLGDL